LTDLSPAAQAVLDAYGDFEAANTDAMAAALRAVAMHLNDTSPWPGHIESTGVNWSSNKLFAIADQLDRLQLNKD
jgi:hypothetical protein